MASRRPLRGGLPPIIFDMQGVRAQRLAAEQAAVTKPEPAVEVPVRDGEDNPKIQLLVGERVTAYLDNGISVTLTHTGQGDEPYRVVVLRLGRQYGQPAQTFATEPVARAYAFARTEEYFERGAITSEVKRQSGRVYKMVRYPKPLTS